MHRKVRSRDWETTIDLTCMVGRNRRDIDHLNRRMAWKRWRDDIARVLRGLRR